MVGDFGWEHEGTKSGVYTVKVHRIIPFRLGKLPVVLNRAKRAKLWWHSYDL